jgi:PAP2 superfamily
MRAATWRWLAAAIVLTACVGQTSAQGLTADRVSVPVDETASPMPRPEPDPTFFAPGKSLKAPPSSKALVDAELTELHALAQTRNSHMAEILCERDISCFSFDGIRIGSDTTKREFPVTLRFLSYALFQLEPITFAAKGVFDRPRPNAVDPTLTIAIEVPGHASFPSGHAAQSTLIAEILSLLCPSRREAFLADAARIAKNREVAGLHYPSDIAAGAELAQAFVDDMHETPWFRGMLAHARQEWRCRRPP